MFTVTTKHYDNNTVNSIIEFKCNVKDTEALIDYAQAIKQGKYGKLYIDKVERIVISHKYGLNTTQLKPIGQNLVRQLKQILGVLYNGQ